MPPSVDPSKGGGKFSYPPSLGRGISGAMRNRKHRNSFSTTCSIAVLFSFLFLVSSSAFPAEEGPAFTDGAFRNEIVEKGVRVRFSIAPSGQEEGRSGEITEGEYADVKFVITDAETGAPMPALRPAAWIDLLEEEKGGTADCRDRVKLYLRGSLAYRPEIDLNSYFILSLNNDPSVSVIDPIVGMAGITRLHSMVTLKKPGEDWIAGADGRRLFISMPEASEVAVIDTEGLKVWGYIDAGVRPVRLALQPDGKYLWVGNDATGGEESGVTIIDATALRRVSHIHTGKGHHEIVFSPDSLFAFVTNGDDGTLSVIDTQGLRKIGDIKTGDRPAAAAFSSLGKTLYVANEGDGTIAVIDPEKRRMTKRISLKPGLSAFRFEPGGRWGFITNVREDLVYILDASDNSISHTAGTGRGPDGVSFTDTFAYIHSAGSTEIKLIRLDSLGRKTPPAVLRILAGQNPPGEFKSRSVAEAIVPAGEYGTILITNPADGFIYYYVEGMEVPMGSFRSYGRIPRAARTVNRNLRETSEGVYTAKVRVPKSGRYGVAFLLDSPQIVGCFGFAAASGSSAAEREERIRPAIKFLNTEDRVRAGENFRLRFELRDQSKDRPLTGLGNVEVIATLPPGAWSEQFRAMPSEDGTYEMNFVPPQPGMYYLFFSIPSLKAGFNQLPFRTLYATDERDPR